MVGLKQQPVDAVELIDRASLRAVADKPGMPPLAQDPRRRRHRAAHRTAPGRRRSRRRIDAVLAMNRRPAHQAPCAFTTVPAEIERLWNVRKGTFPAVGAVRKPGTTVIIEDVAVAVPDLAACLSGSAGPVRQHGYTEGDHLRPRAGGERPFRVYQVSASRRSRPLRRLHGRGLRDARRKVRRLAEGRARHRPQHGAFVELEWGAAAYGLMTEIKALFDPKACSTRRHHQRRSPGRPPQAPQAHARRRPLHAPVDRCIECGFCEPQCPSHGLTLSPRQLIVGWRELSRRQARPAKPGRIRRIISHGPRHTCATLRAVRHRLPGGGIETAP